jgi:4-amino-4-deoxy-L-arabinose transferase-like glycosyltransferase
MNRSDWFLTRIKANIESISLWIVLLIHAGLLGWIDVINAPTFDEIAHVPSGLSHWLFGSFDLYRVNPPLMRMIATVPLLVANPVMDWGLIPDGPYARPEFVVGTQFMKSNGFHSFWMFTICRWAQIPVSMFGGWICFRWARDLFGSSSGFVALLLWCFCPNVLAWGSTITPDLGAAAFGVAAAYSFWRWLNQPTWTSSLLAGATLGLAELSKTTWIILFVLWPVLWLTWRYCVRRQDVVRPQILQLSAILFLALYLLNLGYGFEGSFQGLGQFTFISHSLGGVDAHTTPGNRFRGTWLESIPVPAPANYLRGIDVQKFDFEKGKWSYLRGENKLGGWWYYYLYALAVKTPLGTFGLWGLALILLVRRREFARCFRDELVLLVPAIVVISLVSSQTGFNRYLRYVLPAIPFLYISVSRVGKVFDGQLLLPKLICGFCLAASMFGSLSVFPHSMSYFNLAVGGPLAGPWHLLDANIDWGQDLLELKRFVARHPDVSPIRLAYFGYADPKLAEFPYEPIGMAETPDASFELKPGWYAVSVNHVFGYRHYDEDKPSFTGFRKFTPDALVGYSIYVYHMTEEKIGRLNAIRKQQQ